MRAARIALAMGLLSLGAALGPADPAGAALGPIRLVSRTVPEQAREAFAPAIGADGRYVAFQGTLDEGRKGVFRADLQTGVVERVETGSAYEPGAPGADASSPSISADGRYVAFTTRASLDPADDPGANVDVYVADMGSSPPTYELASAADGSSQTIGSGSLLAPRVALSGDGRKVAFVNGGQVYLRDLGAGRTTLVSVRRNPESGATEAGVPVPGGGAMESFQLPLLSGAALSADGTTVAWVGAHLPEQVPLAAGEMQAISELDANGFFPYEEPLWRRVADGPEAPTRRIVGPYPGLTGKEEQQNPFSSGWLGAPAVDGVPQLSADGRTVAVIGNPTEAANAFLVDMRDGLSREGAIRQLTDQVHVRPEAEGTVVNVPPYVSLNGHVFDLAISADGRELAFVTARQRFPLAPPNLVSPPPDRLGLVELYAVDLETEALERLTHGFGGPDEASFAPEQDARNGSGAAAPSLSADGRRIAFSSTASNLVEGDGNEASDVFAVEDDSGTSRPGAAALSPPPPGLGTKRRRRLALSAFSLPSGRVKLVAVAPAAGRLRAKAAAALALGAAPRDLAKARARARGSRPVAMILSLPRRLRHLAHSREGLYATARVSFHAAGGKPLRGRIGVRFHAHRRRHGGKR